MKKALNIIKTIFVWLVVLLAVAMMIFTVISCTTFNRNDRSIFGYKMYIVNSDSMAATDFNAGSLIFAKEVDICSQIEKKWSVNYCWPRDGTAAQMYELH